MKSRRIFLYSTASCILLIGSGVHVYKGYRGAPNNLSPNVLTPEVKALYHQKFELAMKHITTENLVIKLHQKGIYNKVEFNLNQVQINAQNDEIIMFDHLPYTESELYLYAFIARLESQRWWKNY